MVSAYFIGRLITYIFIVGLAVWLKSYRFKVDKLVALYVLLGLFTDILDKTIIGSNLELYAVYRFFVVCILSGIVYYSTRNYGLPALLLLFQFTLLTIFMVSDFEFNFITFDAVYRSEYGYLNTNQSTVFALISNFICVVLIFYWMYRFIIEERIKDYTKYLLFAFAFLTNFGLNFILKVFDRLLYDSKEDFLATTYIVLITAFFIQHILIILGLKWKQ